MYCLKNRSNKQCNFGSTKKHPMSSLRIFIVEDDPWYGEVLKHHLSLNPDHEVSLFTNGNDCLKSLNRQPDIVCIDFGLPDISGDTLLSKIRAFRNTIPVIVISGQEEISVVLNILKLGATDYIIKDDHTKDLLWNSIIRIRENIGLRREVEILKEQLEVKFSFEKTLLGQSRALQKTFHLIEKAVGNNINVSVSGETGTGKEVVARAIHYNSDRKKRTFVTVNMAAIPTELMESELFGYEKGAFTGAVDRRIGKFEEAHTGTIFLDEIGELDLGLQAKLLRVLQEREVTRLGGSDKIKLDVRVITASHLDLMDQVRKGKFREDLYYRILGLSIVLPPLRERGYDILILAKHFVEEFAVENKIKSLIISEEARQKLMQYNYPGNVRELKAIIDLACVMGNGHTLEAVDIIYPSLKGAQEFIAVEKTLQEYVWDIIQFYLKKYDHNVVFVAHKLGMGKSTIYNMLKEMNSNNPRKRFFASPGKV